MQKSLITRVCILAFVLGALLLPTDAYCGAQGTQGDQCHHVGLLQQRKCAVGKLGGVVYKTDGRFNGGDFMESCLTNAGVACDHPDNGGPLAKPDASCCSCFLYAAYCAGNSGFVTHNPKGSSDHTLLMPASACSGIENWNRAGCPGESIWNEGEQLLTNAKRDALWGMSINPVGRRGQHQMHVHLAEVDKSLMAAIVTGYNTQASRFYLHCGLTNTHKRLDGCTYSATPCQNCPEVVIKKNHASPAAAAPFATAYGANPSNADTNTLAASTLVLRLPTSVVANTWAVVINRHGPAECFFAAKAGSDLMTACPK